MDDVAYARVVARMDRIDAMPPEIRALIHEHGLTMIQAFLDVGVAKANQIAHLIDRVKHGSTEVGDRNTSPKQTAFHVYVPVEPSAKMIEASMAEVSNFNMNVTKYEKHRLRLRAAIKAHQRPF